MRRFRWSAAKMVVSPVLAGLLALGVVLPAAAHQPFFEDEDFTSAAPGRVADPTVSTALYATLESRGDVDYVTFEGQAGQTILLGMTIPAIAGQEEFTPTLAILGAGMPSAGLAELPVRVARPQSEAAGAGTARDAQGAVVLRAEPGSARACLMSRSAGQVTGSGRRSA